MRRYRACIWCKILATAARESHFDTVKIENFSGVDMCWHDAFDSFCFASFSPVFSRADPDLIRGMWDVAQDVADVWGSPAVDLDRALTKAWWEGLMGPRRPTCTSYQLNVSKRSGTVWIPIERATRNEETPCIMRMLYTILHNIYIYIIYTYIFRLTLIGDLVWWFGVGGTIICSFL